MSSNPAGVTVAFSIGDTTAYKQSLIALRNETNEILNPKEGDVRGIKVGIGFDLNQATTALESVLSQLRQKWAGEPFTIPVRFMPVTGGTYDPGTGSGGTGGGGNVVASSFNQAGIPPNTSVGGFPSPAVNISEFGVPLKNLGNIATGTSGAVLGAGQNLGQRAYLAGGPEAAVMQFGYLSSVQYGIATDVKTPEEERAAAMSRGISFDTAAVRAQRQLEAKIEREATQQRREEGAETLRHAMDHAQYYRGLEENRPEYTPGDIEYGKARAQQRREEGAAQRRRIDEEAQRQSFAQEEEDARVAQNISRGDFGLGINGEGYNGAPAGVGGTPAAESGGGFWSGKNWYNPKMPFGRLFAFHTGLQAFATTTEAIRSYNIQQASASTQQEYLQNTLSTNDTMSGALYGLPGIIQDPLGTSRASIEHTLFESTASQQNMAQVQQQREEFQQSQSQTRTNLAQGDYHKTITTAQENQQATQRAILQKEQDDFSKSRLAQLYAQREDAQNTLSDISAGPGAWRYGAEFLLTAGFSPILRDASNYVRGSAAESQKSEAESLIPEYQRQRDKQISQDQIEIANSQKDAARVIQLTNVGLSQSTIESAAAVQASAYSAVGQSYNARFAKASAADQSAQLATMASPNSPEARQAYDQAHAELTGMVEGRTFESGLAGQQARITSGYYSELHRTQDPLLAQYHRREQEQIAEMKIYKREKGVDDNDQSVKDKAKANQAELTELWNQGEADRVAAHEKSQADILRTEEDVDTKRLQLTGNTTAAQIRMEREQSTAAIKALNDQATIAEQLHNGPLAANLRAQSAAISAAAPQEIAALQQAEVRRDESTARGLQATITSSQLRGSGQNFAASLSDYRASQHEKAVALDNQIQALRDTKPESQEEYDQIEGEKSRLQNQRKLLDQETAAGIQERNQQRAYQYADIASETRSMNLENQWKPRAARVEQINQERADALRDATSDAERKTINARAAAEIGGLIHAAMAPGEILHSAADIHERIQQNILEHPYPDTTVPQLRAAQQAMLGGASGAGGHGPHSLIGIAQGIHDGGSPEAQHAGKLPWQVANWWTHHKDASAADEQKWEGGYNGLAAGHNPLSVGGNVTANIPKAVADAMAKALMNIQHIAIMPGP